ncbi:MAG TPA: globin domain-containing protein [Gemmatimonadales bacterium]|nr:globin domain-containing protein [Gemmatimonadales bacterium]
MLAETRLLQLGWELLAPDAPRFADRFIAHLVAHDAGLHVVVAEVRPDLRSRLLEFVGAVMESLGDQERLVELLIAAGRRLAEGGIDARDHETARAALFGALADTLGDRFTPEMDEAWHELFALVSAVTLRAGIARPTPMTPGEGSAPTADGARR